MDIPSWWGEYQSTIDITDTQSDLVADHMSTQEDTSRDLLRGDVAPAAMSEKEQREPAVAVQDESAVASLVQQDFGAVVDVNETQDYQSVEFAATLDLTQMLGCPELVPDSVPEFVPGSQTDSFPKTRS